MTARNWRDAKIPAWVREAIDEEMKATALKAALAWPDEPRPVPAPFRWGDYDLLIGEAAPGTYWAILRGYAEGFQLVAVGSRHNWIFKDIDSGESLGIRRGPLYLSEREAYLALLWRKADEAAETLRKARQRIAELDREGRGND